MEAQFEFYRNECSTGTNAGAEGKCTYTKNSPQSELMSNLNSQLCCRLRLLVPLLLALSFAPWLVSGQQGAAAPGVLAASACKECIRAHMEFLASDALRGRGSATNDELAAANYIAYQLKKYGIPAAGDQGDYLQQVPLTSRKLSAPPLMMFSIAGSPPPATGGKAAPATGISWVHGKEILVLRITQPNVVGPLQKIETISEIGLPAVNRGAIVLFSGTDASDSRRRRTLASQLARAGAAAVLFPETRETRSRWSELAVRLPEFPLQFDDLKDSAMLPRATIVILSTQAAITMASAAEGTTIKIQARPEAADKLWTRNVVAKLQGADPRLGAEVILLSAHLDHIGIGPSVNGDNIYNGADDDASGVTAVLEIARALVAGPRPKRTVIFALFGSEERGGLGSTYFRERPPVPLQCIVANLEFEMIGRPDPALPAHELWLTGYERSNLGPELTSHGAPLVADPHREQEFFQRSDNYILARKGVVAHTISSFGLHKDYHQPSDDLAHIDFNHLVWAIEGMIRPVEWLVNSEFKPQWLPGKKP